MSNSIYNTLWYTTHTHTKTHMHRLYCAAMTIFDMMHNYVPKRKYTVWEMEQSLYFHIFIIHFQI